MTAAQTKEHAKKRNTPEYAGIRKEKIRKSRKQGTKARKSYSRRP